MLNRITIRLLAISISLTAISAMFGVLQANEPHVAFVDLNDSIHPISQRFVSRSIDRAHDEGAYLVIIRINTPGGLLDSTRLIVKEIVNSSVPVVVFVGPSGAHAASAGTFIVAAGHVAAMAPVTNIGAASVVAIGQELPETVERKATQDAAAFLRDISEMRGRNTQALEETIFAAKAYSATEALEIGIIDMVADDMSDLIIQLDGWHIDSAKNFKNTKLDTEDLTLKEINRTPLEVVLSIIADPNIAFILISLGFVAILIEWIMPGLWGPGIIGVIALAVGSVALGNLPVNWVGVGLILFGMGLIVLEIQSPGTGIFGVSGAICFVLGGFFLVGSLGAPVLPDSPDFQVNRFVVGTISAIMLVTVLFFVRDLANARKVAEGKSGEYPSLIGQTAVVTKELNPTGSIRLGGEEWTAISDSEEIIAEDATVMVIDVDGLTLKVFESDEMAT